MPFSPQTVRWKKHALIWCCYFLAAYLLNFIGNANVSPLSLLVVFACYAGTFYVLNAIAYRYFTYQHIVTTLLQLLVSVAILYIAIYVLIYLILPAFGHYLFYADKPFHLGKYIRNMTHHLEPALLTSSTYQLMRVAQRRGERLLEQQQVLLRTERELTAALRRELAAEQVKSQLAVENERLRTAALQSRLKSHWTHGVWMSIRSGILKGARSARLFDLMTELERTYYRYIGPDNALITLAEEIDLMETLATINALAKPQETTVVIHCEAPLLMRQIPALSLSTALENALKYGDLNDPEHPVRIAIKSGKDRLVFTCRNKIDHAKMASAKPSGLGLLALQKQLDLFFPNRNEVGIENDETFFVISIVIHF